MWHVIAFFKGQREEIALICFFCFVFFPQWWLLSYSDSQQQHHLMQQVHVVCLLHESSRTSGSICVLESNVTILTLTINVMFLLHFLSVWNYLWYSPKHSDEDNELNKYVNATYKTKPRMKSYSLLFCLSSMASSQFAVMMIHLYMGSSASPNADHFFSCLSRSKGLLLFISRCIWK